MQIVNNDLLTKPQTKFCTVVLLQKKTAITTNKQNDQGQNPTSFDGLNRQPLYDSL